MSSTQAATVKPPPQSSPIQRYAWVILGVVYMASVAAPLIQNKVPPIMPVIMEAFQIGLSQAGMLMSVFAVTGFLLALPAGITSPAVGAQANRSDCAGFYGVWFAYGAVGRDCAPFCCSVE